MSNGSDGGGSKIGPCCALSIAHEEREREKANGGKVKEPAEVGAASPQVEDAAAVHELSDYTTLLTPSSPIGPQATFVGEQITVNQDQLHENQQVSKFVSLCTYTYVHFFVSML